MHRLQSCISFIVFVVAPPSLAVGAMFGGVSAFSHGQTGLGILALLVAALCAGLWLLAIPAWYLALKG